MKAKQKIRPKEISFIIEKVQKDKRMTREKKFNKKNQEDKSNITQNKYKINIKIYNIRLSNHT